MRSLYLSEKWVRICELLKSLRGGCGVGSGYILLRRYWFDALLDVC